jgi:CubicO group peptidase (beta-lactamase class C family)
LAAIVQNATGKPIEAFAKEYLFTPLGISDYEWTTCENSDVAEAFSGLYLKSRDLLKFGLLYLQNGKWNEQQIIPASWIKQSVTPYVIADDGSDIMFGKSDYGFQWWLMKDTVVNKQISIAACIGNGGQRIFIDQANGLVVVFTGGNYRISGVYLNPYNILKKFIYPALSEKK